MTTTPTTIPAAGVAAAGAVDEKLSTRRLNVMRFSYAFMGVGLAIVKWPLLFQVASLLCNRQSTVLVAGGMSAERAWTFT